MRTAYKLFNNDISCRGYQFEVGKWHEEEAEGGANTAHNGFHCAYNPLDCLSYYSWRSSKCFLVEVGGDVDEDSWDSKIACTRMRLIKELDLIHFIAHAIKYVADHPCLERNRLIESDSHCGPTDEGFAIVCGKNPKCAAPKGTIVGLIKEAPEGNEIIGMDLYVVGDSEHKPNVYYTLGGVKV